MPTPTMILARFSGLDNVSPPETLRPDPKTKATPLSEAMNVDVGNAQELRRRVGMSQVLEDATADVFTGDGFQLAVLDGDLVRVEDGEASVLRADVGTSRMRYSQWPDGRVAYTNGVYWGLVSAAGVAGSWGIPLPASTGTATPGVGGGLYAGSYRVGLCYRRADGMQGGLTASAAINVAATGSISLTALPTLAGHTIDVYLTHHNGTTFYLAGSTAGATFTYSGTVEALQRQARVMDLYPPPAGEFPAFWRGRSLLGAGQILWASRHLMPEHFSLEKDGRAFTGNITLVQPVQAGIFVGTTHELAFLRGSQWDQLSYERLATGPVVKGSGVTVPGEHLRRGDGTAGMGDCMMSICKGYLVAGYQDGSAAVLTQGRYRTDVTEVVAGFRLQGDIPQYIAVPQ